MKYKKSEMIASAIGLICSLTVIIPILTMIFASLKTIPEAEMVRFSLPEVPMWGNYKVAFEVGNLGRSFFNSLFVSSFSVTVSLVTSSFASFILSRSRTKLNRFIYFFFVIGLIAPVNMVTVVKVMKVLGLLGNITSLLMYMVSTQMAFSVFLFYGFLNTVNISLDESAILDGAGTSKIFFQIIFPLLKPVSFTLIIINFMGAWNEFIAPLYLVNNSKLWPMTLAVFNFFGMYSNEWNYIFADVIITIIPIIVVYLLGQKYIVKGLSAGAVKG